MVSKFLAFLGRDIAGLHEAAYVLGAFALLSQVFGLIRDRLLAHIFGAGTALDIYYSAFRIPDLVFVSIASLVSISVLIPFIAEHENKGDAELSRFLSSIFSVFSVSMIGISAVLYAFMPTLSVFLFPTLIGGEYGTILIDMTRILLLSPILLGISNLLGSITQVRKRFILYASGPILYNIGIIIGVVLLYPLLGLQGLAYGVVLGAGMHMLIQVPYIISEGLFPRITWSIRWFDIKRVLLLSLPRTATLSLHQIVFIILIAYAARMLEGSVSVFSLGFNIQSVPLSIIGVSYSVAAFPTLARLFSGGKEKEFLEHIVSALRHILFWSVPATVLFIVLRAQIVRVVLGSGAFDWNDTRLTAAVLALFCVSLVAQSLVLLFVRGYYARGKTLYPLLINSIGSVAMIIFVWLGLHMFATYPFFQNSIEALFRIEDIKGSAVLALPLGYSIGMILNALLFLFFFNRDFKIMSRVIRNTFLQSLAGSFVMGVVAHELLRVFDNIFDINTLFGIFAQGFCAGILGIIAGTAFLLMLGNVETREVIRSLSHKFWKTKTVSAEQETI